MCFSPGQTHCNDDLIFNQDFTLNGECWRYDGGEGGAICFEGDRFRAVTFSGVDVLVTEFFDQQKFTYKLENAEVLHQEQDLLLASDAPIHRNRKLADALSDPSWIDSLKGIKYACTIEEAKKFDFNIRNIRFMESLEDAEMGSVTLWNFNDWYILTMDSDSIPVRLQGIENVEESFYFTEEEFAFVHIEGCDPNTEGSEELPETEEMEEFGARLLMAHSPYVDEKMYFSIKQEGRRLRKLDWMTDFGQWMTGTDYCGPGTGSIWHGLDCPTDRVNKACRKHDHGKKVTYHWYSGYSFPRLECKVDKNIYDNADDIVVDPIYSPYGVMSLINFGCWNYETWSEWKTCYKWGVPYPCTKSVTGFKHRWGWSRYSGAALASSSHGGGYQSVKSEEKCQEDFHYSF